MWNTAKQIAYNVEAIDELAQNQPGWTIDPSRVALLVHDMQYYFLSRFAADTEPMRSLKRNVERLVKSARACGANVFYTAQPGSMTPSQRGLLSAFWGEGMTATPEHRAVWDPISPQGEDELVTKWRYSAFFGNDLSSRLKTQKVSQVVIVGIYGHVGILGTAMDSYCRDYETFIVGDAIADFSIQEHIRTLEQAGSTCAAVVSAEAVVSALGQARN
ncbi:isochorismatase family protein [Brevibacterium picturae]|uniref:Isochorismatase family protein n=1 Tax=Brevibacterium picturae TaxID=260553 RepID=A0ABP4LWT8_9MICO